MLNYEVIGEGRIVNTDTQEEFIDLFGDGIVEVDGETVINFQSFSNADGIDYYTPQGRQDLTKIERMFGTEGTGTEAQSWHIYDPSEVEDEIIQFTDESGKEQEINLSAVHRKTYRKKMVQEIAKARYAITSNRDESKKVKLISIHSAVLQKWINHSISMKDTGAYEMLQLYKKNPEEMTIEYLHMTLHPFGKLYDIYK